jgi:hypothetical protein
MAIEGHRRRGRLGRLLWSMQRFLSDRPFESAFGIEVREATKGSILRWHSDFSN